MNNIDKIATRAEALAIVVGTSDKSKCKIDVNVDGKGAYLDIKGNLSGVMKAAHALVKGVCAKYDEDFDVALTAIKIIEMCNSGAAKKSGKPETIIFDKDGD